jgi:hypothetical protein
MKESWAYLLCMVVATIFLIFARADEAYLAIPLITLAFLISLYNFAIHYIREIKGVRN